MTLIAYGIAFPASRGILALPARFLLDRISAAPTAAFATFRLRGAYSGACMDVRRSSDNAVQGVGLVGGNLDSAALLSFCAGGDGFVAKLYDQSGQGRDFAQATAGAQPKIVAGGSVIATINGLPSLQFDGSNDALTATAMSNFIATNGYGLIGLARPAAGAANDNLAGSRAMFADRSLGYTDNGYGLTSYLVGHYSGGAAKKAAVAAAYPNTFVSVGTYDGTSIKARLNGGAGAAAAAGAVDDVTGQAAIGASNGNYFSGTMAALLTFNAAPALADINVIGADFSGRGGTVWTPAT